jgi:MerR family transcriptional regulator, thiopeptide resistance regulator
VTEADWPIHEVARLAHTTSRTLRHYGQLGLLTPSRVGSNGYRHYNQGALIRLQRILMLRALGLGLPAIADILHDQDDAVPALRAHLHWLTQEQERLVRQVRAVENTIRAQEEGEHIMAEKMFDGFDHTQYRDEVEQRWGQDAYAIGDRWWRSRTTDEKAAFKDQHAQIAKDYAATRDAGLAPDSDAFQAIVGRHLEWLNLSATDAAISPVRFLDYGEMYVADERFAANYGGAEGALFVRDAIAVFVGT